jgi:hypothetical protein
MIQSIKFFLFGILLFISTDGISQKYTEGWFEFGLVSIKSTSEDKVDSNKLDMLRTQIESQVSMENYFTKSKFVLIKKTFVDTRRIVYDLGNRKVYEFTDSEVRPVFSLEVLPQKLDYAITLEDNLEISEGKLLKNKILGFTCTEYSIIVEGKTFTVITTKDIEYEDLTGQNPYPSSIGHVVRTIIDEPSFGVKVTLGMKSFSPNIPDRNIFSVDTAGYEDLTKLRQATRILEAKAEIEFQQERSKFGEYIRTSTNVDLIEKLIDLGALDRKEIYEYDKDNSYDVPSILAFGMTRKHRISRMNRDSLIILFEEVNILTPNLVRLLKMDQEKWAKVPKWLRYKAICIASLKDLIESEKGKRQIVQNLIKLGYLINPKDVLVNDFINGKNSLVDLLDATNVLSRLDETMISSDDALYERVCAFFKIASKGIRQQIKLSRKSNLVIISDGKTKHNFDLNSLKQVDRKRNKVLKQSNDVVYMDTTYANLKFYKILLDVVIQVETDNNSPIGVNIYRLEPILSMNGFGELDLYVYSKILEIFPFLEIDIDALFFNYGLKEDIDSGKFTGVSFPYHPSSYYKENQINLRAFSIVFDEHWWRTSEKDEFVGFVKTNLSEFELSNTDFEMIKSNIYQNLTHESHSLLQYIPNINIVVNSSGTRKKSYKPKFNDENNKFEDAFPILYDFFGEDFSGEEFYYNREEDRIYFRYLGLEHNIRRGGDASMMKFIFDNLNKAKAEKKIYLQSSYNGRYSYIYMKPSLKKELGEIIKLDF